MPVQGLSQERADLAGKVVLELHTHGSGSAGAGPVVQSSWRVCSRDVLGLRSAECQLQQVQGMVLGSGWKSPAVGSTGRRSVCPGSELLSLSAPGQAPSATEKLRKQRDPPALPRS